MARCPRCRGICSCRHCLRFSNLRPRLHGAEELKAFARRALAHAGPRLWRLLREFEREAAAEAAAAAAVGGGGDAGDAAAAAAPSPAAALEALPVVALEPGERPQCDRCATNLVDLHRHCPACGWDYCPACCRELRAAAAAAAAAEAAAAAGAAGVAAAAAPPPLTCANPTCRSLGPRRARAVRAIAAAMGVALPGAPQAGESAADGPVPPAAAAAEAGGSNGGSSGGSGQQQQEHEGEEPMQLDQDGKRQEKEEQQQQQHQQHQQQQEQQQEAAAADANGSDAEAAPEPRSKRRRVTPKRFDDTASSASEAESDGDGEEEEDDDDDSLAGLKDAAAAAWLSGPSGPTGAALRAPLAGAARLELRRLRPAAELSEWRRIADEFGNGGAAPPPLAAPAPAAARPDLDWVSSPDWWRRCGRADWRRKASARGEQDFIFTPAAADLKPDAPDYETAAALFWARWELGEPIVVRDCRGADLQWDPDTMTRATRDLKSSERQLVAALDCGDWSTVELAELTFFAGYKAQPDEDAAAAAAEAEAAAAAAAAAADGGGGSGSSGGAAAGTSAGGGGGGGSSGGGSDAPAAPAGAAAAAALRTLSVPAGGAGAGDQQQHQQPPPPPPRAASLGGAGLAPQLASMQLAAGASSPLAKQKQQQPMSSGEDAAAALFFNGCEPGQEPLWRFVDASGAIQGPFSGGQMIDGAAAGRLGVDTLVCGAERALDLVSNQGIGRQTRVIEGEGQRAGWLLTHL